VHEETQVSRSGSFSLQKSSHMAFTSHHPKQSGSGAELLLPQPATNRRPQSILTTRKLADAPSPCQTMH
jgi:hypothetical protein